MRIDRLRMHAAAALAAALGLAPVARAGTFPISDSRSGPITWTLAIPGSSASFDTTISYSASGVVDSTALTIMNDEPIFSMPLMEPLSLMSDPFSITATTTQQPNPFDPPVTISQTVGGFTWAASTTYNNDPGRIHYLEVSPINPQTLSSFFATVGQSFGVRTQLFHDGILLATDDYSADMVVGGSLVSMQWVCAGPSSSVTCELASSVTPAGGYHGWDQWDVVAELFAPELGGAIRGYHFNGGVPEMQATLSGSTSVPEPSAALLVLGVLGAVAARRAVRPLP